MCGCGGNDQTPKEAIAVVKKALKKGATRGDLDNFKGTGLFLLPDPKAGVLEYQTVIVADLGIDECRKRGNNCLAYKWIPESYISLEKIKAYFSDKGRPGNCFEFCNFAGGGCPPLCWCPPNSNFCR